MKILYVITGLSIGGAEKQVCQLADSFSSIGHDVLLISLIDNIEIMPSSKNVKVKTLGLTKNPLSFVRSFFTLGREIRDFSPSVVHSHMVHANIFCRLSRVFFYIPKLISSAHSNFEGGGWRTFAYRYTDRLSDLTTNVSDDAVRAFLSSGLAQPHKIRVMYNGVCDEKYKFSNLDRKNIRRTLGIDNDTQLVLAVGRLEKAKDFPSLLSAFRQALSSAPKSVLVIVGKGSLKEELKSITNKYSISDKVIFVGAVNSTHGWYSAADLFVSSSAWEGFGLVLAEAMLHGLPVVATDSGGSKEVIGNLGEIVPVGDTVALSAAIVSGLNKSLVESEYLKSERRNFIKGKFSKTTIRDKWLSIYSSL